MKWKCESSAGVDDVTQTRIKAMVTDDDVVLFMKGTPNAPQCGFSNMACRVLDLYEVDYHVRGDALRGRWEGSRGLRVCAACPALLSVSCWRAGEYCRVWVSNVERVHP